MPYQDTADHNARRRAKRLYKKQKSVLEAQIASAESHNRPARARDLREQLAGLFDRVLGQERAREDRKVKAAITENKLALAERQQTADARALLFDRLFADAERRGDHSRIRVLRNVRYSTAPLPQEWIDALSAPPTPPEPKPVQRASRQTLIDCGITPVNHPEDAQKRQQQPKYAPILLKDIRAKDEAELVAKVEELEERVKTCPIAEYAHTADELDRAKEELSSCRRCNEVAKNDRDPYAEPPKTPEQIAYEQRIEAQKWADRHASNIVAANASLDPFAQMLLSPDTAASVHSVTGDGQGERVSRSQVVSNEWTGATGFERNVSDEYGVIKTNDAELKEYADSGQKSGFSLRGWLGWKR